MTVEVVAHHRLTTAGFRADQLYGALMNVVDSSDVMPVTYASMRRWSRWQIDEGEHCRLHIGVHSVIGSDLMDP